MRNILYKKFNELVFTEPREQEKRVNLMTIKKTLLSIAIVTLLLSSLVFAITTPEMVLIPSGTFQIGEKKKPGSYPVHQVTITNDFYMGKYEITNKEFVAFLNDVSVQAWKRDKRVEAYYQGVQLYSDYGDYPSHETINSGISYNGSWYVKTAYTDGHDRQWDIDYSNHPVVYVTWYGAVEYCNWLSRKEGLKEAYTLDKEAKTYHLNDFPGTEGYRLPTEAEWEYAASDGGKHIWAGTSSKEELGKYASYDENATTYGVHMTQEVGSRLPNGFGLYDMSGNVWEWCTDNAYEFSKEAKTDPLYVLGENTDSKHHVCKGGGFTRGEDVCRVSRKNYWLWYNDFYAVNNCHDDELGFRVVRTKKKTQSLNVSNNPVLRSLHMVDWDGNSQAIFDENDSGVAFCFHFDNWRGLHEIKGNWYYPNGELYNEGNIFEYEQSDFENCSKHWVGYEFAEKECALNAMKNNPGEWKIEVFLDGDYLGLLYFEFEVKRPNEPQTIENERTGEILIKSGNFNMGNEYTRGWEMELPVHQVEITYDYYVKKYEVTNAEYVMFLNDVQAQLNENGFADYNGVQLLRVGDSLHSGIKYDYEWSVKKSYNGKYKNYSKMPVVDVTWFGAVEYCNWLSRKNGKIEAYEWDAEIKSYRLKNYPSNTGYRLPTEAEWEYAARGGQDLKWAGTSQLSQLKHYAWHSLNSNIGEATGKHAQIVGQKLPNGYGLYDMSGNVYEWCSDNWYSYTENKEVNPYNPWPDEKGEFYRVPRGGAWGTWDDTSDLCRVANRGWQYICYSDNYSYYEGTVGFRVVRTNAENENEYIAVFQNDHGDTLKVKSIEPGDKYLNYGDKVIVEIEYELKSAKNCLIWARGFKNGNIHYDLAGSASPLLSQKGTTSQWFYPYNDDLNHCEIDQIKLIMQKVDDEGTYGELLMEEYIDIQLIWE